MKILFVFFSIFIWSFGFSQNCIHVVDTMFAVDFILKESNSSKPSLIGIGYVKDINNLLNLKFSNEENFSRSYCDYVDFAEERLSVLNNIINSCYFDSTKQFKNELLRSFINNQKSIVKNEFEIKIKVNGSCSVRLFVSKFIADFIIIPFSEAEFKSYTNQIKPSCKNDKQKNIYRIYEIKKSLRLSKNEKDILNSIKKSF